jgi:hypothetical protein
LSYKGLSGFVGKTDKAAEKIETVVLHQRLTNAELRLGAGSTKKTPWLLGNQGVFN